MQDPRTLHINTTHDGAPVVLEVRAARRGYLDRSHLTAHKPSSTVVLGTREVRLVSHFLARRYARAARPEALDARLGNRARRAFERLLRDHGQFIDDIYFRLPLEQHCELAPDQSYDCDVWVVLRDGWDDALTQKQKAAFKLTLKNAAQQAMSSVNELEIRCGSPHVVERDFVTLRDRDELIPLDLGWPHFVAESDKAAVAAAAEDQAIRLREAALRSRAQ